MNAKLLGPKEQEIMDFLHRRIFDTILQSPAASDRLRQGVRYTIMRMEQRDAAGMVQCYWSAIIATERSIGFAALMRQEGFDRFEEALEEFRVHFDEEFLRRPSFRIKRKRAICKCARPTRPHSATWMCEGRESLRGERRAAARTNNSEQLWLGVAS
ncbi:MAG TPA: hypothetical protein VG860_22550 [Terriglobia bacterium]|jgi:hypothetical protein|nr:hypothetical protein [Terriglobia bacterium]